MLPEALATTLHPLRAQLGHLSHTHPPDLTAGEESYHCAPRVSSETLPKEKNQKKPLEAPRTQVRVQKGGSPPLPACPKPVRQGLLGIANWPTLLPLVGFSSFQVGVTKFSLSPLEGLERKTKVISMTLSPDSLPWGMRRATRRATGWAAVPWLWNLHSLPYYPPKILRTHSWRIVSLQVHFSAPGTSHTPRVETTLSPAAMTCPSLALLLTGIRRAGQGRHSALLKDRFWGCWIYFLSLLLFSYPDN